MLATPTVTGLVADRPDPRMIYWTDGVDQVIRGAPMDSATLSRAAAAVDVRAWAPMPSCVTLIGAASAGAFVCEPPTLYWADQASPPSIRRRFLNGSDVEQVLFDSYLAKPSALVLSRRSYDSLIIADAGKHDLLLARREPLESGDGSTIVIYHDDALEREGSRCAPTPPRTSDMLLEDVASPPASGVAQRGGGDCGLSWEGGDIVANERNRARRRRPGSLGRCGPGTAHGSGAPCAARGPRPPRRRRGAVGGARCRSASARLALYALQPAGLRNCWQPAGPAEMDADDLPAHTLTAATAIPRRLPFLEELLGPFDGPFAKRLYRRRRRTTAAERAAKAQCVQQRLAAATAVAAVAAAAPESSVRRATAQNNGLHQARENLRQLVSKGP